MKIQKIVGKTAGIRRGTLLCFMLCGAMLLPGTGWAVRMQPNGLGSGIPDDATLTTERTTERANLYIAAPDTAAHPLQPVQRVPRKQFGVVGPFPLGINDLSGLTFPSANKQERQALLEGMTFFTTPHTIEEGAGPVANQRMCLGCHLSNAESINDPNIVHRNCKPGSPCVSIASRAARATPTNFNYTKNGIAPDKLDAINGPGQTAAFTIYGDFNDNNSVFDPLDGVHNSAQQFGGFVEHIRPAVDANNVSQCLPDTIPSIEDDTNLWNSVLAQPTNNGQRRSVAERAGPPYIGRGLIEAVPNVDILAADDRNDETGYNSSLDIPTVYNCDFDCVTGHHNQIPAPAADNPANPTSYFAGIGAAEGADPNRPGLGIGRFGLRSNGAEILMFVAGGMQGELGFTSVMNRTELNYRAGQCAALEADNDTTNNPTPTAVAVNAVEVNLSTPFSERNFIRNISPPEFGDTLLKVLKAKDPTKPLKPGTPEAAVQRGAQLFGIDLVAFKNRMIGNGKAAATDGRNDHAINEDDILLGCATCHTPIHRTGQSPATVGARNLSFRYAPIFSDLVLHYVPTIDAERKAQLPRDPFLIKRPQMRNLINGTGNQANDFGVFFRSFDIPRNLTDDVFTNQKATANGRDFRTAPLMGMGRMGPPYLHDARVYLSINTYNTTPASTVASNSKATNAPLVVRSVDEAIRAAIELHDLPAPDDGNTPSVPGAGCPAPKQSNIAYGPNPQDVICPKYDSDLSVNGTGRSEAREVIRRYRSLSPQDQLALIAFLREL